MDLRGLTRRGAPLGSATANDLRGARRPASSRDQGVTYSHGTTPRRGDRGGKGIRIIDRSSSAPRVRMSPLRKAAGLIALISLGITAPAVVASPMPEQLPGSAVGAAPEGSGLPPQQPVAPAPPVATPATPAADGLRPGASGADVKALQRKLRARGIKVPLDGNYGNTLVVWDRLFGTDVRRDVPPGLYGIAPWKQLQQSLIGFWLLRRQRPEEDPVDRPELFDPISSRPPYRPW